MLIPIANIIIGDRCRKDLGDLSGLTTSIREVGLLHPVVVTPDFRLVAGERRLEAVRCLGWSDVPVTVATNLSEALLLVQAERDENTERKALNPTEQLALKHRMDAYYGPQAEARMMAGVRPSAKLAEGSGIETRDQTAAAVGVGHTTLQKIEEVVRAAETEPELAGDLPAKMDARGKVDGAYRELRRRRAEVDVQAQRRQKPLAATLYQGDALEWLRAKTTPMCDLLLTDPPYSTEMDEEALFSFIQQWLPPALAKVKPTGRAYICVGAYPTELAFYLAVCSAQVRKTELACRQVLCWSYRNTIGPSPTHDYKQNWQAILYFVGPEAPPLNCPLMTEQFSAQEISAPDGRQYDRYHAWQKPDELAERFVRHATKAGDMVMDPFAGTGTFLLAAARLGRVAVGCERDPEMLAIAKRRGCNVATE